jgi:hypothetical protein
MNWDAIGAIAELLGAIGVIVSLVYLAVQLKQNTQALRASSYQMLRQEVTETFQSRVATHGLRRSIREGLSDFAQLDEGDAFEFGYWANGIVNTYDNAYYQYRVGMLDRDRWEQQRAALVSMFGNPSFVMWWKTAPPPGMSPEFVALVEKILGEEGEGADGEQG